MSHSIQNKTCIITGANSGLGYWTTMALAEMGFHIFMLCRSIKKGEEAKEKIISATRNSNIVLIQVELSSLRSIAKAMQKIKSLTEQVDILINNAALVSSKRILAENNVESTFAVNHLAPFYFTHLLLPLLSNSSDGRIINVSSVSHRSAKMHFDDISLSTNYFILKAYAQSKLANVLFTYELHRNLLSRSLNKISVYCVDPGHNNTPIGLKASKKFHSLIWLIRSKMGRSSKRGAKCQVYLASIDRTKIISGLYWKNSKHIKSSKNSYDPDTARKLWDLSLQLCGIPEYFNY